MPDYRTKIVSQSGQKDIVIHLSDESGIKPDWLLSFFEQSIREGARFRRDETVQIGWMLTILKETTNGDLEIWEPQFDSMPIQWARGVNNTLRHLMLQKSVAELLGCEPNFPTLQQAGISSKAFLDSPDEFIMTREIVGGDSGWMFREAYEEITKTTQCEYKSLYELSLYCMQIIPFLALPDGAKVTKRYGETILELGSKNVSSTQSETLKRIAGSKYLV
jgi:hypothetical protein